MLDTYVVNRLHTWADWASRRQDSGLGYPKQVPYTNLMPRTDSGPSTPEFVEECHEVERCVVAIRATNEELYLIIMLHYRGGLLTVSQKIKRIGCCKQTYYNKIDMAHRMFLGFLNDVAADVALPGVEV